VVLKFEHFGKPEIHGSFEMWCWRRIEKISRMGSEENEVLLGLKLDRNVLHAIKRIKAKRIGHVLLRYFFLKTLVKEI
jgi:hypothetical protein